MGLIEGQEQRQPIALDGPAVGVAGVPSQPGPLPDTLIDPQAIERLRELDPSGETGVVERVLHAYQGSLARHLADIGKAFAGADVERLGRAAHTLKSSSAAVGALSFSQRCADVEQLARHDKTLPEAAQVQALIDEGQQVLRAVEAMLAP